MKLRNLLFLLVLSTSTLGQGTWERVKELGIEDGSHMSAFVIGNTAYITDYTHCDTTSVLWEWNASAGGWSMMGIPIYPIRESAASFSIGNKGYVSTGDNYTNIPGLAYNDLWEWDKTTNTWTQKANLPAGIRTAATGFAIGNKGYITGGNDNLVFYTDLWQWDQAANTWTQKANFPGTGRAAAAAFTIGTNAYTGTGYTTATGSGLKNDFWEWNSLTNTWTQKPDLPSSARSGAVGFAIGTKGYIATGWGSVIDYKDLWEWDPSSSQWAQKADLTGSRRFASAGFSIGNKGYVLGGDGPQGWVYDFCSWSPTTNTWTQLTSIMHLNRAGAAGFINGNKGYVFGGYDFDLNTYCKDIWEYDDVTGKWKSKAIFPGSARKYPVAFTIGNKSYIGTGAVSTGSSQADFWLWDQLTNTWTQKANFGGGVRQSAVAFAIGGKGYMGTGLDIGSTTNDFWEYDPVNNLWTQKNSVPGNTRTGAVSFVIGNRGYVGTGFYGPTSTYLNDFYEYDPVADTWTALAAFPGSPRRNAVAFTAGNYAFVGTGKTGTNMQTEDFWRWNRTSNIWTQIQDTTALIRESASAFTINGNGYVFGGMSSLSGGPFYDLWKYTTGLIPPPAVITPASPPPMCLGDTAVLTANSGTGYSYQWFRNGSIITGATSLSYTASQGGIYTVQVTDTSNMFQLSSGVKIKIICWPAFPINDRFTHNGGSGDKELIISPNPCSSVAYLSLDFPGSGDCTIEIYDSRGEKMKTIQVYEQDISEQKYLLNTSGFSAGVYFVKVYSVTFSGYQRLIKIN